MLLLGFSLGPFNIVSKARFQLTNTSDKRIAFVIKTTAPKRYCVKPNRNFIQPYATTSAEVMLQPILYGQKADNGSSHKFLWKQDASKLKDIKDFKLQCVFIDEPTAISTTNNKKQSISDESVTNLIKLTEAIAKTNDELIQQINEMTGEISLVTYVFTRQDDGSYVINERIRMSQAETVVSEWRDVIELINIEDVFNDKISYSCNDYQDLIRLNRDMLPIVKKYEFFGDGHQPLQAINKFTENFRRIQGALQELRTGGRSHLNDINQRLNNINNEIKDLRDKYKNVSFA
ncbi:unnamed protein product [Rotaria sp. Silwood2]|nr:unnamed protein product [Rotaria sp. Silwood2]